MIIDLRNSVMRPPATPDDQPGVPYTVIENAIDIRDPSIRAIIIYPVKEERARTCAHVAYYRRTPYTFMAASYTEEIDRSDMRAILGDVVIKLSPIARMVSNGWNAAYCSPFASTNVVTPLSNADGSILAGIPDIYTNIEGPVIFTR